MQKEKITSSFGKSYLFASFPAQYFGPFCQERPMDAFSLGQTRKTFIRRLVEKLSHSCGGRQGKEEKEVARKNHLFVVEIDT